MKSSFFLVIPEQKQNPGRLNLFNEAALGQWLEELPWSNYGLSVQLFYDLLVEFNKTEMDPCFRLAALKTMRPKLLVIQEYLRSRLIDSGFPKAEDQKQIFKIQVSVQKEFAISYWISTKALTKNNSGWLKGKEITLAIQRVMSCLSEIIVSYSLFKLSVPGWIWIDLHSLYSLSKQNSKSTTKVLDQTCVFKKGISIEDTYKRILLFSLSHPNGLRQKEVVQAYRFSEFFCSYLGISNEVVPGQRSQNIVMTEEDREPFQISTAAYISIKSQVIFLNFTKIAIQLKKKKKAVKNVIDRFGTINLEISTIDKLPLALIEYIELSWAGFVMNNTAPFIDRTDRSFAIGLTTTHKLLSSDAADLNADSEIEYFAETSSDKTLILKSKLNDILSIGSLVSPRKLEDTRNKRAVGVISRISMATLESSVDFEVRLLGEDIKPALINIASKDTDDGEDIPVLFYIVQNDKNNRSYLIVDSFSLKDEDIVRLDFNDKEYLIVLRKRKNIGLGFWRFECRRIKEHMKEAYINKQGDDVI